MKSDPDHSSDTKIKVKSIKGLKLKPQKMKMLEKSVLSKILGKKEL